MNNKDLTKEKHKIMVIKEAINVLKQEAQSILHLTDKIGLDFEKAVEVICLSTGRVIISGIGKSGLIARKIVATLTSTGTNAMFLHPVEAMHGDLGMVTKKDVFIAISNSGETQELNILMPSIKKLGCTMIAFTGNLNSSMAKLCDLIIDTGVEKEACPLGLAPTCSTTAQLAMGDALAVVLISKKHFNKNDFKRSHPGGALGKRLSCMVGEIMFSGPAVPHVPLGTPMNHALDVMEKFRLGAVFIVDEKTRQLEGIITDGDIRHCIAQKKNNFDYQNADEIMTRHPHVIMPESPLYDALNLMEKHQITVLPVVNGEKKLQGVLHLHDILGKGAFNFSS